ncbi:amidohydrolase family protein [Ideonella livida]|uniref:Amidohydrolase n=1 Tax=Ideonella livida TaxID=2707176 RepID=A0A7C9PF89_9BURK|nr:amidohydrolase family protein [Ideonella livida]NDY90335.1 amidohydrolase [Ideonella livida]
MSHALLTPCACGALDVHAHFVPEHFPAWLDGALPEGWPATAEAAPQGGVCHRQVLVGGRHYRTVSESCWSVPRRLAELPAMGLTHQLISPMPELLGYWLAPLAAQRLCRFLNETAAALAAESGGVLLGLAAVPLPDVDAAIAELRHAVQTLGLVGVELGSHINGSPVGDPRWRPFLAACEALDVPVFVHALKPVGQERLVGPAPLLQVLGYPSEVGLAAASVITGGLLQACPRLRLAFSHGGGTLASLLPRLQQGWQVFPALRERVPESPAEQARRLFYDTLVFDPATLAQLLERFGPQALMLGTDHPFNFREAAPAARVQALGLDAATTAALLHGNARRFLGTRAPAA